MRRRKVIQIIGLGVGTSAFSIFSSCSVEQVPNLKHLKVNQNTYRFLQSFCANILPIPEGFVVPESQSDFVLSMIDACSPLEQIELWQSGLDGGSKYVKMATGKSFKQLSSKEKEDIIVQMLNEKTQPEIAEFANGTRSLLIRQFTTSQKYMVEHRDFEFAPGYYETCAST